jgi:hypothetical protein
MAKLGVGCAKGRYRARRALKSPCSADDVDPVEIVRKHAVVWVRSLKIRRISILEENRVTRLRHPPMLDVKDIPADV